MKRIYGLVLILMAALVALDKKTGCVAEQAGDLRNRSRPKSQAPGAADELAASEMGTSVRTAWQEQGHPDGGVRLKRRSTLVG